MAKIMGSKIAQKSPMYTVMIILAATLLINSFGGQMVFYFGIFPIIVSMLKKCGYPVGDPSTVPYPANARPNIPKRLGHNMPMKLQPYTSARNTPKRSYSGFAYVNRGRLQYVRNAFETKVIEQPFVEFTTHAINARGRLSYQQLFSFPLSSLSPTTYRTL